jgi:hypothetical protein
MPEQYPHPDPNYLRDLYARDPISYQLYLRGWRSAYIRAMASALLRFVWRHIKQPFRITLGKRYPLTSEAKALIANLMSMR